MRPWGNVQLFPQQALAPLLILALCGCAQVDPGPDLARTARLIEARSGHPGLIDPAADEQTVMDAVRALLVDGLSVEGAVAVALLNNPDLRGQFQDVGISSAALVAAGTLTNPSLFVSARLPHGGGRSNISFSISQNVIDLLLIPVRERQAELDLDASRMAVARAAVQLVAQVRQACYRVLALDQARALAEEMQQLVQHSLEISEHAQQAGLADRVDVDQSRSDTLDARRQLLELGREQGAAQLQLRRLLGLSRWNEAIILRDELPRKITLPTDETLTQQALEWRLDARIAELEVERAEEELTRQGLLVWPDVALGIDAERAESPPSLAGPSLALSLPIWNQNDPGKVAARFLLLQQRARRASVLDTVSHEVHLAADAVRADEELLDLLDDELLPQATLALASATRAYQAGLRDVGVLIQAQRHLVQEQRASFDTRRHHAFSIAELERALGGRLADLSTQAADRDAATQPGSSGPATQHAQPAGTDGANRPKQP